MNTRRARACGIAAGEIDSIATVLSAKLPAVVLPARKNAPTYPYSCLSKWLSQTNKIDLESRVGPQLGSRSFNPNGVSNPVLRLRYRQGRKEWAEFQIAKDL